MIGTQPAQVLFSGLTPGVGALYVLNVVVPPSLAAGTYPITVSIGGKTSAAASIVVSQAVVLCHCGAMVF